MSTATMEPRVAISDRPADTAARLNYANVGLITLAFAVALFIPFELFLFAYAVLGPGHYLTEIAWLKRRNFYAKGRWDGWMLAGLGLVPTLLAAAPGSPLSGTAWQGAVVVFGLGCGLVFFLTAHTTGRLIGIAIAAAVAFLSVNGSALSALVLATFVPTLVHVYLFTGLFMFYGALKTRSQSGYIALAVFLICPLLYLVIQPPAFEPSQYVLTSYWSTFSWLNKIALGIQKPATQREMDLNVLRVFHSTSGLTLMRFVAFAYTYHYLNWFSKTSIIQWHQVGRRHLTLLSFAWAACVGVYLYDYSLGFKLLSCLSIVHVYLEFPLNHLSVIGTWRELRGKSE